MAPLISKLPVPSLEDELQGINERLPSLPPAARTAIEDVLAAFAAEDERVASARKARRYDGAPRRALNIASVW